MAVPNGSKVFLTNPSTNTFIYPATISSAIFVGNRILSDIVNDNGITIEPSTYLKSYYYSKGSNNKSPVNLIGLVSSSYNNVDITIGENASGVSFLNNGPIYHNGKRVYDEDIFNIADYVTKKYLTSTLSNYVTSVDLDNYVQTDNTGTINNDLTLSYNKALYLKNQAGANLLLAKISGSDLLFGDTRLNLKVYSLNDPKLYMDDKEYTIYHSGNLKLNIDGNNYAKLENGIRTTDFTLANNIAITGINSSNNPIRILYLSSDNNVNIGSLSNPLEIKSSINPVVNVGSKLYTMYHTGNKPTAIDVGAIPITGGTFSGVFGALCGNPKMYLSNGSIFNIFSLDSNNTIIGGGDGNNPSANLKYYLKFNESKLIYNDGNSHTVYHTGNLSPLTTSGGTLSPGSSITAKYNSSAYNVLYVDSSCNATIGDSNRQLSIKSKDTLTLNGNNLFAGMYKVLFNGLVQWSVDSGYASNKADVSNSVSYNPNNIVYVDSDGYAAIKFIDKGYYKISGHVNIRNYDSNDRRVQFILSGTKGSSDTASLSSFINEIVPAGKYRQISFVYTVCMGSSNYIEYITNNCENSDKKLSVSAFRMSIEQLIQ